MAINLNVDFLKTNYFTFEKPVDFKQEKYEIEEDGKLKEIISTLKVYPVTVRDWLTFANCVVVLDLEKNNTDDISIIQMSYLKWILTSSIKDEEFGNEVMPRLYKLMNICFKTEDIVFDLGENQTPIWYINGFKLNSKDFDYFRKLVMYQNISEYEDDSMVDSDFKKAMEEYNDLANRGVEMPSLERQIVIVANERHVMEEVIYDMSYRKFRIALAEINGKIEYQINKTAEVSGMVEFKQPIDHWIYKAKKDRYSQGLVDVDALKDKINKANG